VSRIYDALKRAERRETSGPVLPPVDGRAEMLDGLWDLGEHARLEYERLQVWITNRAPDSPLIHGVMVASCQRRNGATTTAMGLAATLARRPGARVLIVDANLRAPSLDRLLGAEDRRGLSDLLNNGNNGHGAADYVQATSLPNLSLLTAGVSTRSALEVFSPASLTRLVTDLKSRFDFVVFDASPFLEFPDAYALAPHVDAVVLVVEAERTLVDDARRVIRQLERSGIRAAGVVLNRQRDYTPRLLRRALYRANGSQVSSS
jgi:capsular exopolysaccharide synthesis family protein